MSKSDYLDKLTSSLSFQSSTTDKKVRYK